MNVKREKIIVLKTFPFSESDLILRGLNSSGLKMSFIAKGALKSKRVFSGGVLEPCSFIELEYRASKNSLYRISQAWFLRDFRGLRAGYNRLTLALYFVRLAEHFSTEGGEDSSRELFNLLGNALIEAESSAHLENLKLFFQVKLLFLQGVLPDPEEYSSILNCALKEHQSFKQNTDLLLKSKEALNHYMEAP